MHQEVGLRIETAYKGMKVLVLGNLVVRNWEGETEEEGRNRTEGRKEGRQKNGRRKERREKEEGRKEVMKRKSV